MTRTHDWFTSRAKRTWASSAGRSVLCIVPNGCADGDAAAFIKTQISQSFEPPTSCRDLKPAVIRVVPDGNSSCGYFVRRLAREFRRELEIQIDIDQSLEPSEYVDELIEFIHENKRYPVVIIERFHSFARIADEQLHSVLSRFRTLEQASSLTTIAISPLDYNAIRRKFPKNLPFVNSVYGDSHDRFIMSPLSFEEFRQFAERRLRSDAPIDDLFACGGGPDIVYQALIDEFESGIEGIEVRVVARISDDMRRFLEDAIENSQEKLNVLSRLVSNSTSYADLLYLRHIPQSSFLIKETGVVQCAVAGSVLRMAIFNYLQRDGQQIDLNHPKNPQSISLEKAQMKVLFFAANPVTTTMLDLEEELRAITREIMTVKHREIIEFVPKQAARPDDLIRYVREERPTVIHFSGHGSDGGIVLRLDGGGTSLVSGESLRRFLQGRGVKLVFLNACYSEQHAREILPSVQAVVGTTRAVDDEAALRFSVAFYRTIGNGHSVSEAFRDGGDSVQLHNLPDVFALVGDGAMDVQHLRSNA